MPIKATQLKYARERIYAIARKKTQRFIKALPSAKLHEIQSNQVERSVFRHADSLIDDLVTGEADLKDAVESMLNFDSVEVIDGGGKE